MTLFVLEQDEEIAQDLNMPVLFICWMRQIKDFLEVLRRNPASYTTEILGRIAERHYRDWIDMYWGGYKSKEDYYEAVKKDNRESQK